MNFAALLVRILGDLGACRVEWALVGGLAVGVHTEPRFTRDLDLAVAVSDDKEAEGLVHAMVERGYRLAAVVKQKATGRLATVRLVPSDGGAVVDLLFASSGIEREVVDSAAPTEVFEGAWVRVASLAHLIALKVLARDDRTRPQDRVDLCALLQVASEAQLAQAREALTVIASRGFARKRDLLAALELALAELVLPNEGSGTEGLSPRL